MDPKKIPKKYAEINLSTYRNRSNKLNSLNLLETTLEVCSRNQPFPNAAITRILLRSVFLVDQNAETHCLDGPTPTRYRGGTGRKDVIFSNSTVPGDVLLFASITAFTLSLE